MLESELTEKIAEMCSGCAFVDLENGNCKLIPSFLSKRAQEGIYEDGFCPTAGVLDADGKVHKAINYFVDRRNWVLTIQDGPPNSL